MLEIGSPAGADFTCIVLHGLGADGSDLAPLARQLWPGARVHWLFPDAPMRPITINGGMPMRGWYDVSTMRLLDAEDADGIRASATLINGLVAGSATGPARTVLLGFSQGGAMALHCAVRQAQPLAGVVALSCYLPLAATVATEAQPATVATPVFLAAGDADPVIAPHDTLAAGQALAVRGHAVTARTYPMGHAIVEAEIADIATFLAALAANG